MANSIHSLACVDPQAELGDDIEIGPFCVIGPHVKLGNGCQLANNVTIVGAIKNPRPGWKSATTMFSVKE
ncbi:MAG: UDP-N-acetylglucosamine acyltransferase [Planctomycetota bacterium]|nr:MAG: UDP-N-acetylglucosamine acyltransferase [Planctomycetota bacterium]